MDNLIIVDVDESVVYSRSQVPGSTEFFYNGETNPSYTIVRPSAKPFLQALKDKGYKIICMTQGEIMFQRYVLQLTGLWDSYEDIYGYYYGDSHWQLLTTPMPELPEKWVLVDNLPQNSPTLQDKRKWLKSNLDNHFVQCIDFHGLESEEDSLLTLLPEIDRLLA